MASGSSRWAGGARSSRASEQRIRALLRAVLGTKLSSDAFVEELEVTNECLHYQLLAGSGPERGWVNLKLDDQELLRCIIKARQESLDECRPPFFCAWYSGGFSPKDGEKLLAPLIEAVRDVGLKDAAIFHFPDAYGMTDEGREPWASYIDLLIEEIDKIAGSSRPLILFGHSRGAAPATCVAYRQPERVRKVYIAACGAMQLGEATGWELLSHSFKQGGDRELLKWFSSLQPQNILLHRTAHETSDAEFEEQVQSSKFLSDMLQLMRCQYRDAMYPDPARDFGEMEVSIMAFSPLLDPSCQPEHCKDWGRLTNDFQLQTVNAGHMDCLQVQAAPILWDGVKLEPHCPFLSEGVEMHRTLQNFAQVQAKQRGEGVCELFARICKDLLQFL